MLMAAATTIRVRPETKKTLASLGEKGMSYDKIIEEVVSGYLAHVDEIYERVNAEPFEGRPLEEIVNELEGSGASRGREKAKVVFPKE
jgi:hypothetical protein